MKLYKRRGGKKWWGKFQHNGTLHQFPLDPSFSYSEALKQAEDLKAKVKGGGSNGKISKGKIINNGTTETIHSLTLRIYKDHWSKFTKDHKKTLSRALKVSKVLGGDSKNISSILEIDTLIETLSKQGLKGSTINRYLATLKLMLTKARDEYKLITSVPKFPYFREPKGHIRIVSKDELEKLKDLLISSEHLYYPKCAYLFELLANTGLRLNEALSLNSGTIDLDNDDGHIYVIQENSKTRTNRIIPMNESSKAILRTYPNGFNSLKDHQCQKAWKYIRTNMQLLNDPEFTIHSLRHTFASNLIKKGVDIFTVKELLGHSSIKTTQRYSHLETSTLKKAVDKL